MINLFRNTEIEYIRCFSEELETEQFIRFWDNDSEDMYANNITVIKKHVPVEDIVPIINKEIKLRKKLGKEFLVIEIDGDINRDILDEIKIKPSRVDKLDYMYINTEAYNNLSARSNCKIKEVVGEDAIRDATNLSILDNAPTMGEIFSTFRIGRKIDAYKDESNKLESLLCCDGNIAVGSCELLINDNVVKIEDFGIIGCYRRQGYGTSILRETLKRAHEAGSKYAYVITENSDTAKDMYIKCGFQKIAEKTQVIYSFY